MTKRGCIAAGKWLAEIGAEDWSNSSSVDFPKEVKPRFRHNVSDLMVEGFRSVPPVVGINVEVMRWLIMEPQKPLNEYLAQSLQEQRQYIERLTKRADALEKWLARSSVPYWARRTKHGKSLERGGTG